MRLFWLALMLACSPWSWSDGNAPSHTGPRLVVEAGEFDRSNTLVTFKLPPDYEEARALQDPRGRVWELQTDSDGNASFIEEHSRKGSAKTYVMLTHSPTGNGGNRVTAEMEGARIRLLAERLAPIYYQGQAGVLPNEQIKKAYRRGGYLHPIMSPSGLLVTDDYPPNHLHHHGLWFSWTQTRFRDLEPDFWNMGQEKGTVEFESIEKMWSGGVHGGFRVRHRFRELSGPERSVVLSETWEIRLYRAPPSLPLYTMFDFYSRQECGTDAPLLLPKYHYGGLAFRGNREWDGAQNAFFLTSDGETDRVKGNESRGRWCYMGGNVNGKRTGIIILCHPDNFRAPQPLRLHPNEPYLCFAPQQLGEMEIRPGQAYVSRYRCITMDGPPDKQFIEGLFNDYAHPPTAKILPD